MRREFKWTEHQLDKLNKVRIILDELNEYKPLTLRQIYYQLVGKGYIKNCVSEYNMLSGLLKWGRIYGYIDWNDIEDRVRVYNNLTGWSNVDNFIQNDISSFLKGYKRNLVGTQNRYIEIWIEKDTFSTIFKKVCNRYTISVVVCKGFSSISFLNDYKERLKYYEGFEPVILYFGDFDPSGVEMLESMKTTFKDELGIENITFRRVGLLKDDIDRYNLPNSPDTLKKKDTRTKKHILNYGDLRFGLDT